MTGGKASLQRHWHLSNDLPPSPFRKPHSCSHPKPLAPVHPPSQAGLLPPILPCFPHSSGPLSPAFHRTTFASHLGPFISLTFLPSSVCAAVHTSGPSCFLKCSSAAEPRPWDLFWSPDHTLSAAQAPLSVLKCPPGFSSSFSQLSTQSHPFKITSIAYINVSQGSVSSSRGMCLFSPGWPPDTPDSSPLTFCKASHLLRAGMTRPLVLRVQAPHGPEPACPLHTSSSSQDLLPRGLAWN